MLVVSGGFGAGVPVWTDARSAARYPVTAADLAAGRAALAALPVKGPASSSGYTREQFGQAWADVDGNGCDTRNDVLAQDLADVSLKPGTHDCVVLSGTLADPYTGTVLDFARGPGSTAVQIDHVVALSAAWRTGAQGWSARRREQSRTTRPTCSRSTGRPTRTRATAMPRRGCHRSTATGASTCCGRYG